MFGRQVVMALDRIRVCTDIILLPLFFIIIIGISIERKDNAACVKWCTGMMMVTERTEEDDWGSVGGIVSRGYEEFQSEVFRIVTSVE